jgi:protein involved in polysaccharide export with SLBB domain
VRTQTYILFGLPVFAALAQNPGATERPSGEKPVFLPELSALAASATNASAELVVPATSASPEAVVVPTTGYVIDDKHKLIAGDKLSFQILEDRMLKGPKGESKGEPKSLVVTDSIELDVPYIGRVSAANKTCKQLAEELKGLLEKEYYYRATVIVGLDQASKILGKVYVLGPVRTQGPVEIPANETFTAGKAILRAGGFGDFADKKNVKVVRKGTPPFLLNMVDILEKGKTESDIALEPEDFIIVPQRAINF